MRLTATRTKIFTLVLLLSFLCSTFPALALGIPKVERTTSLLSEAVETQNGYGTEEAYGEHYEVSPTTNQAVADANNFLYTGQQLDKDIGQYYLRARFYDAGLGHFTVRDPIRHQAGINMYAYVNGNPINATDPSGLNPTSTAIKTAAPLVLTDGPQPGPVDAVVTLYILYLMSGDYAEQSIPPIKNTQWTRAYYNNVDADSVLWRALRAEAMRSQSGAGGTASAAATGKVLGPALWPKIRPEGKLSRGGKHGVKWTQARARVNTTGNPQGQWTPASLQYANEFAKTVPPGKDGEYFDLPTSLGARVHMPGGGDIPASRMWIRNNGTGTWHGYPGPPGLGL